MHHGFGKRNSNNIRPFNDKMNKYWITGCVNKLNKLGEVSHFPFLRKDGCG